jgi:hypothetical protein
MKQRFFIIPVVLLYIFSFKSVVASDFLAPVIVVEASYGDSIKKESKEEKRKREKQALKDGNQRLMLRANYMYATLQTDVTFKLVNSVFSAKISLEKNLKLPGTKLFFTADFIYRFTPRSGIYAAYYGITRKKTFKTDKEYVILGVTIPTGINGEAYFDTRVLSVGYLLTILEKKHVFFSIYFNAYILELSTGFKAEHIDFDVNYGLTVPLPSFGLAIVFPVNNWFKVHANVGYFGVNFGDVGGHINSFSLQLEFKPIRWLGINVSYQSFDINLFETVDKIEYIVDYNFRGPAIGLSINF